MTKRSEPPSVPPNKVEVMDCSVQLSEEMKVLKAFSDKELNVELSQTEQSKNRKFSGVYSSDGQVNIQVETGQQFQGKEG